MRYFDKLIRRLAGRGFDYTLRPEQFLWDELYDPFENSAVLPLTYPHVVERVAAEPFFHTNNGVKSRHSSSTPLLAKKSLSNSLPRKAQGEQRQGVQRFAKPLLPQIKATDNAVQQLHETLAIKSGSPMQTQRVSDKTAQSATLPAQSPSIVKRNIRSEQDSHPMEVELRAEADGSEKRNSLARGDLPNALMPIESFRRRNLLTDNAELKPASITPLAAAPKKLLSRKRKTRIPKKALSKLVIGRLKVNVVPVKPLAKPPVQTRVVRAGTNGRKGVESSKQAQKLGFGLGQM